MTIEIIQNHSKTLFLTSGTYLDLTAMKFCIDLYYQTIILSKSTKILNFSYFLTSRSSKHWIILKINQFQVQNESNRPYTGPFYRSYSVFWHIMSYLILSYHMISYDMISYDMISYDMIAAAAPRLKQVQTMENRTFFMIFDFEKWNYKKN